MKNIIKTAATLLFASSLSILLFGNKALAANDTDTVIVCIDPGHGADANGAQANYGGVVVNEKDVNLMIALYLREYLEQCPYIDVVLTRTTDVNPTLAERVDFAYAKNADYFISIHNNAATDPLGKPVNGCMVLTPCSHYQVPNAKSSDVFASSLIVGCSVLSQLHSMGIPASTDFDANLRDGIVCRGSECGDTYEDGSLADYYGVIRASVKKGIPSMIIEHAYITSPSDFAAYLCTPEKLKDLAYHDAQGIINGINAARAAGLEQK